MKNLLILCLTLFALVSCEYSNTNSKENLSTEAVEIEKLMQFSIENGIFNGVILVSDEGEPIYKKAWGYADKNSGRMLTEASVFYLASVSKQFTTMAIMILNKQNKLSYDDKLSKYFPEFPDYADSVTIRHMMQHTSGIADHYRLGMYKKGLTNADVLDALLNQTQLDFSPGEKFSYSNGGYVLLSLIVEKASGMPFHEFMDTSIFKPLGMTHTLVYDESAPKIENRAVGYDEGGNLDDYEIFTTGAGGMYSNLDDLHLWDLSLYSEKLVSKSSLEEAFTPAKLNNGESNDYGFGWGISEEEGSKVVQHSGGLAGYRTYLKRVLDNKSGYIILTNHGNASNIGAIMKAIDQILKNEPYTLPKIPVSTKMAEMLNSEDVAAEVKKIRALLDKDPDKYSVNENGINSLGYTYLADDDLERAMAVFKLNVDYNSASWNVYDSWAEGLLARGDTLKSIENYKKSLELNRNNTNAVDMLKKIGVDTESYSKKVEVSDELLASYVGEYKLNDEMVLKISKEGNDLFIHPTGQSKSQIFASTQNRFYSKMVDAQISFNKNDKGSIESLTLHQNGHHEAKKIK